MTVGTVATLYRWAGYCTVIPPIAGATLGSRTSLSRVAELLAVKGKSCCHSRPPPEVVYLRNNWCRPGAWRKHTDPERIAHEKVKDDRRRKWALDFMASLPVIERPADLPSEVLEEVGFCSSGSDAQSALDPANDPNRAAQLIQANLQGMEVEKTQATETQRSDEDTGGDNVGGGDNIQLAASMADVQPMDAEEAVQLVTEETAPMEVDVVCDDEISIYGEDELQQMEEADMRWIRERCEATFGPHPDNTTGGNGGNVIVESVDIDTVVYQPKT